MRNEPERPRRTWAAYITAVREAAGMSRAEMARRLKVDPSTIWRWETGRQKPESTDAPLAIATLFQVDLDDALAAAGLKPGAAPEPPPVERDEEMELILTADVPERTKRQMVERLLELRERDKQRRIDELSFYLRSRRTS